MIVTETDFKLDPGRYLEIAANDDITITRDHSVTLVLAKAPVSHIGGTRGFSDLIPQPNPGTKGNISKLIGILPPEASLEAAREERLSKI